MTNFSRSRSAAIAIGTALGLAGAAASAQQQAVPEHPAANLPPPPASIGAEGRARAVALATEGEPMAQSTLELRDREAVAVVSQVTELQTKGDVGPRILVTLYRYDDGVTIRRTVDVERGEVVGETVSRIDTPPLADVEFELAKALALRDPRVKEAIGPEADVDIDALVSGTVDEEDPRFGHRVVHLSFRRPEGYIAGLEVIVDLTTAEVEVER